MTHYHMCYACESEWECYDVDCMGANILHCDLCDEDEEPIAVLPTDIR
jgi:hypothetical protein